MADHLAALGIGSDSQEERQNQVRRILKDSKPQSRRADGMTLRWSDPSGAELWIYVDESGAMKSVQPHFAGGSRITMALQELVERPEFSPFDGGFIALTQSGGTNPALGGGFPVVFDAPDFPDVKDAFLTAKHDVELAAFAVELNAYDSEEAFREAQPEMKALAARVQARRKQGRSTAGAAAADVESDAGSVANAAAAQSAAEMPKPVQSWLRVGVGRNGLLIGRA